MINFTLSQEGPISEAFLKNNCKDFASACQLIQSIPYARNTNKNTLLCVLLENKGTCSTKHALLKILLEEHRILDVKLMLGIFLLTVHNTPIAAPLLAEAGLKGIPEAHCYLRLQDQIFDFTFPNGPQLNFEKELLRELEIQPSHIARDKVNIHRDFIKEWLTEESNKSIEDIWTLREHIIQAFSIN